MTTTEPPAAPAAPAQPAPNLEGATSAAQDRLAQAFPDAPSPGAPAAPPAAPPADGATPPPAPGEAPFDIFAPDALEQLDLGNLQYRDGARLQRDIAAARDRFKPFNDAFGSLSDEQRTQLLESAPTLGADLATFGQVATQLHAEDRAWMFQVMDLMATDPVRAGEMLAAGAETLRGALAPAGAPAPDAGGAAPPAWPDDDGQDLPPEQRPVTRGDLDQWAQQRDYAAQVHQEESAILAKARELGYSPDSQEPFDRDRFQSLISFAGQPEVAGDLDKAHLLLEQRDQAIIDRFVAGKQADASRPGAPADAGAPPADVRELSTTEDARAAMNNRLDATLGPDPRRRSD